MDLQHRAVKVDLAVHVYSVLTVAVDRVLQLVQPAAMDVA